MWRSFCWINFGFFSLGFMLTFQYSEAQGCQNTYRVGRPAYFQYNYNSSVHKVEYRLQTTYNGNKTTSCDVNSHICENNTEFMTLTTANGTANLTINQMQTNYKSLSVFVDGVESQLCYSFMVFAPPENFTCSVEQSSKLIVRFNAYKFYPEPAHVTVFTSNGTLIHSGSYPGSDQRFTTLPYGTLPYFNLTNKEETVDSKFLRRGANTFLFNFTCGDVTESQVSCSTASIDIYPTIASFTVNEISNSTVVNGTLNSSVTLTCQVGPVPAVNITLSRRGMHKLLSETTSATSITYVIPAFGCFDRDEYVCTLDTGQGLNVSKVDIETLCPPVIIRNSTDNLTLSTENGGSVYLPLKVIASSDSISVSLKFTEDGVRYTARWGLYTYLIEPTSPYYYNVNMALHDFRDADFRDYILTITNGGDGVNYYFTVSQIETSVDVRGAAIGVGVIAIALLIVVVILVLVMCHSRRKKVSHQPAREMDEVKPETYDSTGTSWGTDHKSEKTAASKTKLASHPLKTAISRGSETTDEQKYEPISENSKPHRPAIPLPQEEIYEIEPDDNSRPPSFYGNITEQPIYGNL